MKNPKALITPGKHTPLQRYQTPLFVFVVMLVATFAAYRYLDITPTRVFILVGVVICVGVLVVLLVSSARYERQLGELASAMLNLLEDLADTHSALETAHAFDSAVMASMADGTIVADATQHITRINDAAQHMLGIKREELIGRLAIEVIGITDVSGIPLKPDERPFGRALKLGIGGGVIRDTSSQFVRANGSRFAVDLESSPLIANNKVVGVVTIFRDVTEERRIDIAKNEFISLASHQLRTPLTSIGWYSQLLLNDTVATLTEEQHEYLEQINQANRSMIDLVDALLNVSRTEMGIIHVAPVPTDLGAFIESQIAGFKPLLKSRNIKVETVIGHGLEPYQADPKLLTIIIQNILSNAFKYSNSNDTVKVEMAVESGVYVLTVRDHGMGIPQAQQEKIFTKLFRADNARLQDTGGSGLGLYLVKAILERIGGSISFISEEGNGTTFTVALPRGGMREETSDKFNDR